MDAFDLRDYAQSTLFKVLGRYRESARFRYSDPSIHAGLAESRQAHRLSVDGRRRYYSTSGLQRGGLRCHSVDAALEGQRLNVSVVVQNLLKTPESLPAIPIRMNPDGSIVRIKDVGRTELGTEPMMC